MVPIICAHSALISWYDIWLWKKKLKHWRYNTNTRNLSQQQMFQHTFPIKCRSSIIKWPTAPSFYTISSSYFIIIIQFDACNLCSPESISYINYEKEINLIPSIHIQFLYPNNTTAPFSSSRCYSPGLALASSTIRLHLSYFSPSPSIH